MNLAEARFGLGMIGLGLEVGPAGAVVAVGGFKDVATGRDFNRGLLADDDGCRNEGEEEKVGVTKELLVGFG